MMKERARPATKPARRRAWVYTPPAAPSLADWRAGGERRQAFMRYWLHDNIGNAADMALYFGFKLLPAGVCSALGGFLGRLSIPRWHKAALMRAEANIRALQPGRSDAEIAALLVRYAESRGRLMTEYSIVGRLARNRRRISFVGAEGFAETCAGRPVIFMALHTSNWEVLGHCLAGLGVAPSVNYVPPKRRARHWIVNHVRRSGGLGILQPGKHYARPALRLLEAGGRISIMCDEGFKGRIRGPFLGRPPHLEGNYALIARLARMTNALIYPVYLTRERDAHFTFHALPPFLLPPREGNDARQSNDRSVAEKALVNDVVRLNAVMEPIIVAHAEQWYFIDNRLS